MLHICVHSIGGISGMGRDIGRHGGEWDVVAGGAQWGMAARQGRATASGVHAPFYYVGTDKLA
jgi:hypothetical protein